MEVITIDAKAYKELIEKINTIAKFVLSHQSDYNENPDEMWVDSYEVCTFLKISDRTLQRLRTRGAISYSILSGKAYYTIAEVRCMLDEKLIRSNEDNLSNLIKNHRLYAEQRRNLKSDR